VCGARCDHYVHRLTAKEANAELMRTFNALVVRDGREPVPNKLDPHPTTNGKVAAERGDPEVRWKTARGPWRQLGTRVGPNSRDAQSWALLKGAGRRWPGPNRTKHDPYHAHGRARRRITQAKAG
jgi:hypothetical protein